MPVPLIYRMGRNKKVVSVPGGYSEFIPQVGWRVHLPGDPPRWYKVYAIEVNIRGEIEAMVHDCG